MVGTYVGYTAIEVATQASGNPRTKVGWLNAQVVAQEKPAAKLALSAAQILVKQTPLPSPVVTNTSMDVAILANYANTVVTSVNMDVLMRAIRPPALVTGIGLDVIYRSAVNAQVSWMGVEALHGLDPAVQANFTWMGLSFLVPSAPKISTSWMGVQALVDINSIDDIPDYMNFGSIFDATPGATVTSSPVQVTGMTANYPVTIYSDSDITMSKNGVDYTSTLSVQFGDTIRLRKVVTNVYTQIFRIYTTSDYVGEQEIGIWQLPGPSGTLKYDQYLYQSIEPGPWVEFKKETFEDAIAADADSDDLISHQIADAPTGDFSSSLARSDDDAPLGNYFSQLARSEDLAPTGNYVGTKSFLETTDRIYGTWFNSLLQTIVSPINEEFTWTPNNAEVSFDVLTKNTLWYPIVMHYFLPSISYEATISEKLHYIYVSKVYAFNNDQDQKSYNPVMEYWKNWENITKAIPEWMYDRYQSFIEATPEWEKVNNINYLTMDTYWDRMTETFYPFEVFQAWERIQQTTMFVKIDGYFSHDYSYLTDQIDPYFEPYNNPLFVQVFYTYEFAINNILVQMYHRFEQDQLFESTNYIRQGGFATPELAENAAESYPDNLTVVYQQPEGTYSFDVIYDNALWCGDAPVTPVIRAVGWYMGGG